MSLGVGVGLGSGSSQCAHERLGFLGAVVQGGCARPDYILAEVCGSFPSVAILHFRAQGRGLKF